MTTYDETIIDQIRQDIQTAWTDIIYPHPIFDGLPRVPVDDDDFPFAIILLPGVNFTKMDRFRSKGAHCYGHEYMIRIVYIDRVAAGEYREQRFRDKGRDLATQLNTTLEYAGVAAYAEVRAIRMDNEINRLFNEKHEGTAAVAVDFYVYVEEVPV